MKKQFGVNAYTFLVVVAFWFLGSLAVKTLAGFAAHKGVPGGEQAAMLAQTA